MMLANYGTSSSNSLCEVKNLHTTTQHSRSPLVSCTRTQRRHLVMPSLRSLVTSSSSTTSNPTTSVSRGQRPSPKPAEVTSNMGASSSTVQLENINTSEEACSRLIAPRPSLIPALSPKRPMKRDASCGSLLMGLRPSLPAGRSTVTAIRKCETVLALSSMEPLKPINRLRVSSSKGLICSRCSSLLSMASASRTSLNTVIDTSSEPKILCKLCLCEEPMSNITTLQQCQCCFCTECLRLYAIMEVAEAAYEISCPDALCDKQGILNLNEIEALVSHELMSKHRKFRLDREVDMDNARLWCPRAGCETVCRICPGCLPQSVHCPTCEDTFCSSCKQPWHPGKTCNEDKSSSKLIFDPERIKLCPMCGVPIEKDEGCAQMMCKRCKHVFCWYCLASLDDDFLLRHYDKGPCKNKLGHSRASVIWHRTQVIAIFAGFGVLLLVASPLLLLAAPCIVCCKCRACQDKLEEDETSHTNVEQPSPNS